MDASSPDPLGVVPDVRLLGAAPAVDRVAALAALIGDLAAEVQDDPASRLALVARDAFARLARLVGAARVALHRIDEGRGTARLVHEWSRSGVEPLRRGAAVPSLAALPWTAAELARASVLVDWQGPVARSFGVGSVVAVPLLVERRVGAVLSLQWLESQPDWSPELLPLVRTAGVLIGLAERSCELAGRAAFDEVSGLANRKMLLEALGRSLSRLGRGGSPGLAVMALQVVGPGDAAAVEQAVTQVGSALDRLTADSDLIAVFDARTVVALCEDVANGAEALSLARRLHEALVDPAAAAPNGAAPSGSELARPLAAGWRLACGVAHTTSRVAPGVVLRQADAAAYRAAEGGEPVRLSD